MAAMQTYQLTTGVYLTIVPAGGVGGGITGTFHRAATAPETTAFLAANVTPSLVTKDVAEKAIQKTIATFRPE